MTARGFAVLYFSLHVFLLVKFLLPRRSSTRLARFFKPISFPRVDISSSPSLRETISTRSPPRFNWFLSSSPSTFHALKERERRHHRRRRFVILTSRFVLLCLERERKSISMRRRRKLYFLQNDQLLHLESDGGRRATRNQNRTRGFATPNQTA